MKKLLFVLFLYSLFLTSCAKDFMVYALVENSTHTKHTVVAVNRNSKLNDRIKQGTIIELSTSLSREAYFELKMKADEFNRQIEAHFKEKETSVSKTPQR